MSINEVRWLSECGSTNAYAKKFHFNQIFNSYKHLDFFYTLLYI
jgi:hypothetical protein